MNILYENLMLRAIEEEDMPLLLLLVNDPETESGLGGWSFPVSKKKQYEWYNCLGSRQDQVRLIIDTEEYGAIGLIALTSIDFKNSSAEIHIKLKAETRGKEYASKAYAALIKYAVEELGIYCLYAYVLDTNIAGKRALEKAGMKQDGVLRSRIYKGNKRHDLLALSIMREDRS